MAWTHYWRNANLVVLQLSNWSIKIIGSVCYWLKMPWTVYDSTNEWMEERCFLHQLITRNWCLLGWPWSVCQPLIITEIVYWALSVFLEITGNLLGQYKRLTDFYDVLVSQFIWQLQQMANDCWQQVINKNTSPPETIIFASCPT